MLFSCTLQAKYVATKCIKISDDEHLEHLVSCLVTLCLKDSCVKAIIHV